MVFLNPSILLGLLAASIPILIHLLNFRKLQKVEFSTLAFLKELQKSKIKKVKIKQWLLLLLRVLIIVFLVLAFARPTLETVNIAGSTSTAKSSSIFIIDNSFSMNYIGEDGSYFNKSKKIAKEIISAMEDGDELSFLISKDSIVTTINLDNAIKIIDNLNTNFNTEPTQAKIESAITFLEEAKNLNKEVFLFSDFQKSTFMNWDKTDSLSSLKSTTNIKFYSFDMSVNKVSNYSIDDLVLKNSILELNKPITFEASIHNYSEEIINNITASLFLNEERVAQQNVTLNPMENKKIELQTSLSNNGLIEARVELEDDNLNSDNKFYLNFWVPEKIKILLLFDKMADIEYLEAAINSATTNGQFAIKKMQMKSSFNEQLTDYDVIFLVSGEITNTKGILQYLNQGGKIVFIPSSTINSANLSTLQNAIKLPSFDNIITSGSNDNYTEFEYTNITHPIFLSLFENSRKGNIASPVILKYIKFRESVKTESIIKLMDGSVFLGEYNFGSGKVMFMNSTPDLEWNNLPIKGIFAPLVTRIIIYLSSIQNQNTSFVVGENLSFNVNKLTFPLIDVEQPNGNDNINLQNYQQINYLYKHTQTPGSYKFYSNKKLINFATVNINPKESELTKVDNSILSNYYATLFTNNYFVFSAGDNFLEKISKARYGTELWKFLLVLALLMALLEMFIARSAKKDLVSLN